VATVPCRGHSALVSISSIDPGRKLFLHGPVEIFCAFA
jgi:hypothetical protein